MRDLPIDDFLRRVREMPDIEALEQIELRQEQLALQTAVLSRERQALNGKFHRAQEYKELGQELQVMAKDGARLSLALKQANRRIDRAKWSDAVRTLLGEDAWAQCREWMAATEERAKREEGVA